MKSILLLLALVIPATLHARSIDEVPSPKQGGARGWISDPLNRVAFGDRDAINGCCARLWRETGVELAAAVVDRTDGRSPKEFATALFSAWGVGDRTRQDGVLLLVVLDAHRAEIEVGRALPDRVPPYRLNQLVQSEIVPYMKRGDVGGGMRAGIQALDRLLRELGIGIPHAGIASGSAALVDAGAPQPAAQMPYVAPPATTPPAPVTPPPADLPHPHPPDDPGIVGWGMLATFVGLFLYLLALPLKLVHHVLGGGAPTCKTCNLKMVAVPQPEAGRHLERAEQLEEELGSATHEVWTCTGCGKFSVHTSGRWFTRYSSCPGCHHYTARKSSATVESATYTSSGYGETTTDCSFCSYHDVSRYTIAMLVESRSSSSDSSWSSSDSSSSSSFGGGSSDGSGGGGGSW